MIWTKAILAAVLTAIVCALLLMLGIYLGESFIETVMTKGE